MTRRLNSFTKPFLFSSRGETRKIVGDDRQAQSTDKVGLFDSSHIVMKRWADFERDRRYRSGNHSRDSTFDNLRSTSLGRTASNRFSVISSVDTFTSSGAAPSAEAFYRRSSPAPNPALSISELSSNHGPRYPPHLELPAPLANSISSPTATLSSDFTPQGLKNQLQRPYSDTPNNIAFPRQLMASPQQYPRYEAGYDSDEVEREAILGDFMSRSPISEDLVNHSTSFHHQRPDREQRYVEAPESLSSSSSSSNIPVVLPVLQSTVRSSSSEPRKSRGVSLVDSGPVPGSEGMRVVQRQRRHDSQLPLSTSPTQLMQSPRSRNSMAQSSTNFSPVTEATLSLTSTSPSLPPGAAPPQSSSSYH